MIKSTTTIEMAAKLTIAWLTNSRGNVTLQDASAFLVVIHDMLVAIETSVATDPDAKNDRERYTPAVSARESLASPNYILSMIDGKPYQMLRPHLFSKGLTPDEYRKRYGLEANYPMISLRYSLTRRSIAKEIGLGRNLKIVDASAE